MAEKRRFLDVWLVETNTVYREVPFAVVSDWVQQSRLLPNDMLRPSGTAQWFKVGDSPDFAPYVPRSEPYRVGDQAEALEPVHLDFGWKRPREDEDEDVDMIPLIDVSLVLLIFFLMTASVATGVFIDTPGAVNSYVSSNPEMIVLGVDVGDEDRPVFSIGTGDKGPEGDEDQNIDSVKGLVERLDAKLRDIEGGVEVTIKAHKLVDSGVVRDLTAELTRRGGKIQRKFVTVSERRDP